jgi:hypothetical protein
VSFGVFCVEADAFCETLFGAIEQYASLPEAEAACADWRKVEPTKTFLPRQVMADGRPYEGAPPVIVKEEY